MSRTKKGSKPPGYEFWSKRPGSMYNSGRAGKTETKRREREAERQLLHKEKRDVQQPD